MGTKLRGIHIDPYEETVKEVEVDSDTFLKDLYKLCRCRMVEYIYRENEGRPLHIFIDEEGRITDPPQRGFGLVVDELNGQGEDLRGPAVILGQADHRGKTQSAPGWCTVENIKPLVMWLAQSHAENPDHWIVKILIFGGSKPHFGACAMHPHSLAKIEEDYADKPVEERRKMASDAGYVKNFFYRPQDFGFKEQEFNETIAEASKNPIIYDSIMETLDKIRVKIAKEELGIETENLFLMREPVLNMPKSQGDNLGDR